MYKVLILAVACLMAACSPVRYVPVESVRTEWRDRDVEHLVSDTVRDTRVVLIKGDTVVDVRDRWHTVREYVHDTVSVATTDTIRVPYPVERALSRWEQTKMDFGGMALGALALALCVAVVWLIKKFRR